MTKEKAGSTGDPRAFSNMTAGGKIAFIGKALVFIATFGFAFPTIFSD